MIRPHPVIAASILVLGGLAGCNRQKSAANVPDGDDPISVRPQIVRVQKIEIRNGVKHIQVGNTNGTYSLAGNQDQPSCITPAYGADYFLFTKETRWKFSGAKDFATLAFFQDWSGKYNNQDNVALVPVFHNPNNQWETKGDWGIFWLESWQVKQ